MSKKIITSLLTFAALITTVSTVLAVFYNKKFKHNYCTLTFKRSQCYCPENDSTLKAIKSLKFDDDIDE